MEERKRMPRWLKREIYASRELTETRELLSELKLNTVCHSALCPNAGECYSMRRATFMILGDTCTRNCRFCAVKHGIPEPVDSDEALKISRAVRAMELRHVVVTSVTRDDMEDGGASHFVRVIEGIRQASPDSTIEVLTPDFKGDASSIEAVASARPHVFNHNLETVPRLYRRVRPGADYKRSLGLLQRVKEEFSDIYTKSGIMVGLGETEEEVYATMEDLRAVGCDILTIGQYLQPSRDNIPVEEYVPPELFEGYRRAGLAIGFASVFSGPFVRSSFHAGEVLNEIRGK